jgi:xanthine dehydrogenase accessory factor
MNIYDDISEVLCSGKDAVLCTIIFTQGSVPRKAGSKMLVFADRQIKGSIGGGSVEFQAIQHAVEIAKTGIPEKKTYQLEQDTGMQCGGSIEVFFDPLRSKPPLYIFGAGHVGRVLAHYAKDFGFNISLFDQRENIFNSFPSAGFNCKCGDYFQLIEDAIFTENSYIVIVTPMHEFDEGILRVCCQKPHAYLGMIGSRKKVQEIGLKLMEEGLLTSDQLEKIDMPIGIKFAAETPEEIAISILARLIDVKNTRHA